MSSVRATVVRAAGPWAPSQPNAAAAPAATTAASARNPLPIRAPTIPRPAARPAARPRRAPGETRGALSFGSRDTRGRTASTGTSGALSMPSPAAAGDGACAGSAATTDAEASQPATEREWALAAAGGAVAEGTERLKALGMAPNAEGTDEANAQARAGAAPTNWGTRLCSGAVAPGWRTISHGHL